jgi:chromate transporter
MLCWPAANEVVEKYKWLTHEELLNYYAISQAAPGIIAINTATFVGYNAAAFWGNYCNPPAWSRPR